jgi:hypothetical protein
MGIIIEVVVEWLAEHVWHGLRRRRRARKAAGVPPP